MYKSFPNSGTTFTLNLIRELTNTTTATNYRLESEMKDGDGERLPDFPPAFPDTADAEKGPFLHVIPQKITYTPKLILTKTHCNGVSQLKLKCTLSCALSSHFFIVNC